MFVSTIISQYWAPSVDFGMGLARLANKRYMRFSARHDVDLATALRIPFPSAHSSQYPKRSITLMPNWRAVSRNTTSWAWPREQCKSLTSIHL